VNNSNPPNGYGPWHPQATMHPPPMTPYGYQSAPPHVGYASAPPAYGGYGSYAPQQLAHPYNSAYGSAPPARGYAPPVGIDLVAKANSLAWKRLFGAIGGLLLSVVITVLGAVTGVIAFIGIILFLICLVAIPIFIWNLFDPTLGGSTGRLGPNKLARERALREISPSLTSPDTWRVQLKGGMIYLTGAHFVYIGGWGMDVVRSEDMVWFWNKTVTRGRIFQRKSHYVAWKTRHGDKTEAAVGDFDNHVMPTLMRAYPHAIYGFDRQTEKTPIANLAYEVDRRRAAARGY